MNLVFVSREQYPNGGAATNRHIAYAKGLIELGHEVTFILVIEQTSGNREFIFEGIRFICAIKSDDNYVKYHKIKKAIFSIIRLIKELQIANDIHKSKKIDALILLTPLNRDLLSFIWLAKSIKVKVLHERTEYPVVFKRNDKIKLNVYLYIVLRNVNGIYVINHALKDYLKKYVNVRTPIEIINMIVDPKRFQTEKVGPSFKQPYIAYCGTLNDEKDGVDILVKAYANALNEGKLSADIKLLLIGDYENDIFRLKLEKVIKSNDCQNNILFTGLMKRDEVPSILNAASALVLARPRNKQAEGGFPTKLGEYLATGKPVIITETGEINLFLKDGFNAFLAKPGDIDNFSEKIVEVFSDYNRALEIGSAGRKLVENEFNYYKQAEKLAKFIASL